MRPQVATTVSSLIRLYKPSRLPSSLALNNYLTSSQRLFASSSKIPHPSTPITMATPISAKSVIDLIKIRRSYYPLSKDLTISKARIQEIVKEAVAHVPSSFNAQSNRVVVLFDGEHEKLWDITAEVLKGVVPEENWKPTGDKLAMFKGAAGSVLFFEEQETVQGQQKAFSAYADKFPTWATQSDAMLQYAVWVALEAEGLGANLQHYNPLIDKRVAAEWKLPASWKLNAQLNFGGKTGEAGPKQFKPVEELIKVFGA